MRQLSRAIIIPASLHERVRVEDITPDLAIRQHLVGGAVEVLTWAGWHVVLNDEARYIPMPPNPRAEVLIRQAGIPLEGTVGGTAVILGHSKNGKDRDVPGHLLRLADFLFDTALAA